MTLLATTPPRFGRYMVGAIVHESAESTVYRCCERLPARDVAIKRAAGAPPAARRLLADARLRGSFDQPHILPVLRVIRSRDGTLVVSPWLPGGTLEARLRAGPLAPDAIAVLASGIGSALDAVHAAGWWHGDLSARNVLYAGDGRPVLADFGTARRHGRRAVSGEVLTVTPAVAAPEVCAGRPGDGRSDLYSLGMLIFVALAGTYPFDTSDTAATLQWHQQAAIPLCPGAGRAVNDLLRRALAKNPAARPQSGKELAAALTAALLADGADLSLAPGPGSTTATNSTGGADATNSAARSAGIMAAHDAGAGATAPSTAPNGKASDAAFASEPDADSIAAMIAAAGRGLDRFAMTLDARGQAALGALLQQARFAGTRAQAGAAGFLMQVHGPAAALLALETSGAARALAHGPATASELAERSGLDNGRLERLLLLLTAAGLIGKDGDRFLLPDVLAAAYAAGELDPGARSLQATAVSYWARLGNWLRSGEPVALVDSTDGAGYSDLTPALAVMNERPALLLARELQARGLLSNQTGSALPSGPHTGSGVAAVSVLDVGAGAAVWSVALAQQHAGVRIAALDRPLVLETAVAHAASRGVRDRLVLLAGDWRTAPLGAGAFDLAIVANLCHLHDADDVLALFRRLRAAVRPGGCVVVVDTIPETMAVAPLAIQLQSLDLALRTPHGGVHDAVSYRRWLSATGFTPGDLFQLDARHGALTAV